MSLLLHQDAPALLGSAAFLAKVVSVQDRGNKNRVQVRLLNADGVTEQDALIWARVAVPFAGDNRGAFFLPDVNDEVLVVFLSSDPRFPVVIGGLWSGAATAPETLGGDGKSIDRWTITGKAGTRIAIVEQPSSSAAIEFSTPGGLKGTLSDEGGGSITFTNSAATTVTIDSNGIKLNAPTGKVQIMAAEEIDLTAPTLTVNAAMSQFKGVVQGMVVQTPSVVASTYTPGAGNIL